LLKSKCLSGEIVFTIWLSISAGSGPEECAHCASLTLAALENDIKGKPELSFQLIESEASRLEGNFRSCLVAIESKNRESLQSFADSWTGIIQWIWNSTYRPHHKRKNWFIQVKPYVEPEKESTLKVEDVRFETMRAGGPGGQYVNKTESAVRAIHVPTGKSVVVRNERSQLMNKKLAMARLAALLEEEEENKTEASRAELRHSHWELRRGNPIRVFDAATMKELKAKSKGVKINGNV
jgi:peptide chain release factor